MEKPNFDELKERIIRESIKEVRKETLRGKGIFPSFRSAGTGIGEAPPIKITKETEYLGFAVGEMWVANDGDNLSELDSELIVHNDEIFEVVGFTEDGEVVLEVGEYEKAIDLDPEKVRKHMHLEPKKVAA